MRRSASAMARRFAMDRMLQALMIVKNIDAFVPIIPEEDGAAEQYGRIFQLMSHHMTSAFGYDRRCVALGILTTNWMLGHPVKRLIADRLKWNKKKGRDVALSTTIRKVLEDVEQIARFQAPRYLACYSDILRMVLPLRGRELLSIPDLTLPLEFGVRSPVQLGLMALGLSRSSTLAIAAAVTDGLTAEEAREATQHSLESRLMDLELKALQLPQLVIDEVAKLQSDLQRRRNLSKP